MNSKELKQIKKPILSKIEVEISSDSKVYTDNDSVEDRLIGFRTLVH